MDYFEKFLKTYQEAQLKDADDSVKWAAKKCSITAINSHRH